MNILHFKYSHPASKQKYRRYCSIANPSLDPNFLVGNMLDITLKELASADSIARIRSYCRKEEEFETTWLLAS
jgi:hypothetical protein